MTFFFRLLHFKHQPMESDHNCAVDRDVYDTVLRPLIIFLKLSSYLNVMFRAMFANSWQKSDGYWLTVSETDARRDILLGGHRWLEVASQ